MIAIAEAKVESDLANKKIIVGTTITAETKEALEKMLEMGFNDLDEYLDSNGL